MGAALCACAGRADDDPGVQRGRRTRHTSSLKARRSGVLLEGHDSSLLQTQSRAETRELLSDEEREAMGRHSAPVGGGVGLRVVHMAQANALDDHADETESDEIEYYNRQQQQQQQLAKKGVAALPTRRRMSQATVDAFHSKLREPIMSPRSKLLLLGAKWSVDSDECDDRAETCSDGGVEGDGHRRPRSDSAVYDIDPAEDGGVADEDDEYFEFVRIIVPPGPCGVVFQMPSDPSMPPTVDGFTRVYDGSTGPIENSGLVRRGSTLCAINDLDVTHLPLSEVIRALNLSAHLEREFVFRKRRSASSCRNVQKCAAWKKERGAVPR